MVYIKPRLLTKIGCASRRASQRIDMHALMKTPCELHWTRMCTTVPSSLGPLFNILRHHKAQHVFKMPTTPSNFNGKANTPIVKWGPSCPVRETPILE